MSGIFSDHMVFQSDVALPIWGRAEPGEVVTVTFARQSTRTTADATGQWRVQLRGESAGVQGSLLIEGRNRLVIQDVLVGEVWLASGQSNMQLRVNEAAGGPAAAAGGDLPGIRMFTVPQRPAGTPADDCAGQWIVCQPDTVGRFSATAFYFARELHGVRSVPIGIINASWGATPIEAWTSVAAMTRHPQLTPVLAPAKEPPPPGGKGGPPPEKNYPGYLFNGMIAPLIPYALRGVIWYQGENNANSDHAELYALQLPVLIDDWRQRWGTSLPFAWVQLPNFQPKSKQPSAPRWPIVREAMLHSTSVEHTGMAITIDLGEADNIHPRNKQEVGHRLALWARARVYGETIAYSGPLPESHAIENGKLVVTFSHADGGLVARDGPLRGFLVAGPDRQWTPAEALIRGNQVVVSSPRVAAPVAVRYAWADNPACNLFNGAGLPASPFRTDDWTP